MFTINTLRNISAQTAYQYLIFTLVTYFLCIQAWDQSPTTNAAIATWIIGLVAWVIKKETGLTADQKKVIGISCSVFIFSLASWLLSDFDLNIKKIEPDIRFLLFGLTVIAVSYSQLTINQLSAALILAGISYGGSALYEYHILGNTGRVNGDENAVTYGNGSFLIASCIMFIYFTDTHKSLKIIAPIGICLAVLSAVYSGTRGSFIAIIPLTFIVLYKLNNKNKIVFSLLLTSLLILALNYTNLGDRVIRMQTTIGNYVDGSNTYTSAGVRLDLWKSAFCMFKENPVFGVGPRSFRNEMNVETSDCVPVNPKLKKNNQAHNVYMNTIATKGSVGLFSFLALLLASVLYAFRNNNPAKYIVFAAIASMLSYGLTVDLLFKSFLVDRHLVLIAILIGVRANQK